jgi:hypothetical protein
MREVIFARRKLLAVFPSMAKARLLRLLRSCQKNIYGLIVVPKMATIMSRKLRSNDTFGSSIEAITLLQGTSTVKAATT